MPGFDVVATGERLGGEPQHAHQEPELRKVGLDALLHGAVLLALVRPARLVHKLDLEGQAGQPAAIRALPLLVGPPKPVGTDHQHAVELENVLALELPRRGQVVAPADLAQHGAGQVLGGLEIVHERQLAPLEVRQLLAGLLGLLDDQRLLCHDRHVSALAAQALLAELP